MTRQAKHKKRQGHGHSSMAKSTSKPAPQANLQDELLNLQRSAGNKVVTQLLKDEADEKHHTNVDASLVGPALNREGQPLDASARSQMEALFNEDFSGIRIHTNADAAESAQAVDARAYTAGEDVVFGANQYRPNTDEGKQLIAHELAHTVQHRDAGPSSSAGAGTSISRAPLGTKEPEPISLFSSQIPAPVVTRMGNVIVATVYFGQKFSLLDSRNLAAVQKLGDELKFMFEPSIAVDGHASSEGKEDYNQKLSESRRSTVLAVLQSKLSGPATFTGNGHGASELAVEETGKGPELESQKALNRRVTIVIIPPAASVPETPVEKEKKPFIPLPRIELPPRETDSERLQRMMKEAERAEKERKRSEADAPGGKSLNDWFYGKVDKVVEDAAKKLGVPEKFVPYLQDGARSLIEKGTETALDKALDQTGLDDAKKEALKAAIEAAAKSKPK